MKKTTCGGAVVALMTTVVGCGGGGGGRGATGATASPVAPATLTGALVEARAGHTATPVGDGLTVLIAGGETLSARASSTAELWRAGRSAPLPASMTTP